MVWIYLAESEESPWLFKDISDPLLTAKLIDIVKRSWCPDNIQEKSKKPQSGMISELSTEKDCVELSTLLSAASRNDHARTSALQEMARAWQESEVDFFGRSYAWPKRSSPSAYSLKTQKESSQMEGLKSLKRLPPSGMTAAGSLRAVKRLGRHKIENDGFVWPTTNTFDHLPPRPWEALKKQFETARKGRTKPANLREAIHKECYPPIQPYDHKTIGLLNPQFAEWLMGYPLEWSALDPSLIPYVLSKQKKHLKN